jgi:hypothetical protein
MSELAKCGVPWCAAEIYPGSEWCQYHDAVNPFDTEDRPRDVCGHCGKELEDFSDLGCVHCDRRVTS